MIKRNVYGVGAWATLGAFAMACTGCSDPTSTRQPGNGKDCAPSAKLTSAAGTGNVTHRAYVASRDSGNVTVIDLDALEVIASVDTCSPGYHMVELNSDFTKAYATSPDKKELDVLDVRTLAVTAHINVGAEPTHMSLSKDGRYLAVVNEKENAVSFVDPRSDVELVRIPGFYTPHFVRYAPDGHYAYVANLGAYHITRIDLDAMKIDGHIALDGFDGPPNATQTTEDVGFADVQIDAKGVLWAAHGESGRALVYDTKTQKTLTELDAGVRPWIVYAEHPFAGITARVVPNHGDRNVAFLDRIATAQASTVATGEPESYGVNYSSKAPEKAFVMNRIRKEIAVVNTETKTRDAVIDVGGNTETASTTADGRYIVAAVSSANRVVVIDAVTNAIVKTFDGVGNYPWTVTIPLGQNYCH